jgi:hypothetical protein
MPTQTVLFPEFQAYQARHSTTDVFVPMVVAEAPAAIRAMPEANIDEKIVFLRKGKP